MTLRLSISRGTVLVLLLVILAACALCGRAEEQAPASLAELQQRLRLHVGQPRFRAAAWGVKIVSLDSGATLFATNDQKLFKPASNAKLFTGAMALDRLGPAYRIRTSFYATQLPDRSGVLKSDLTVFGRGDFSFAARFHDGNYSAAIRPLLDAVHRAGIRKIEGDLVGDESYFQGSRFGSGWTWDDLQYYYGAEVSALTIQDNVVDLFIEPGERVGAPCRISTLPPISFLNILNQTQTTPHGTRSNVDVFRPLEQNTVHLTGQIPIGGRPLTNAVAVHQPARWFLDLFRQALREAGIEVTGKSRITSHRTPSDESLRLEIAHVESPPLSALLPRMMKPSQNLYAQLLWLQTGVCGQTDRRHATAEDLGLREMKNFLGETGVPARDVLLEEGSGLSRSALVTPEATVNLLRAMAQHRHANTFYESLPIAGRDGTLRNRMKSSLAEGNVRAKTGTLRYVNTLSGYVTNRAGERLVFSVMLNNYFNPGSGSTSRDDVDAIAVWLAESNFKSALISGEQ
ncbi:MAG: D-alanyl-D-alanine carboxypeptidase/D-alanyl-D-alanine-endopeptidase [Verrucomicrobiota bacterium]